jgi:hypothetical protein
MAKHISTVRKVPSKSSNKGKLRKGRKGETFSELFARLGPFKSRYENFEDLRKNAWRRGDAWEREKEQNRNPSDGENEFL